MAFYFRKSISLGPLRFNLSRSGLGASIGVRGARVTATATGKTYVTVGSHGFYYRQSLGTSPSSSPRNGSPEWRSAAEEKGDIVTASVEDLAESTASELVEQLNKRARISSFPAWALIAASVLAFLVLLANWQVDSSTLTADQQSAASHLDGTASRYVFDIRGEKLSLASLRGQVLVLNFWKKRCAACPRQLVLWNRVRSLFQADRKVSFLRINSDAEPTLGPYRGREMDGYFGRDLAGLLGLSRVPAIFVLDQNGQESSRIIGLDSSFETALRNSILSAKLSSRIPPPAEAEILTSSTPVSVQEVAVSILSLSVLAVGLRLLHRVRQKRRTAICYELDPEKTRDFVRVQRAFERLGSADCVWRVTSRVSTYDWKRNAGTSALIERKSVHCGTLAIPNVSTNVRIIGIDLGQIRIYPLPDFVLYWQSGTFAPISYSDLRASCHPSRYVETERVPRDAMVVDKTWRYVNKNGSPDRRFNNNISIPVVAYAGMTLVTTTGLKLDFYVSSLTAASEFVDLLSQRESTAELRSPRDPKATTSPKLSDAERAAAILGTNATAAMDDISASYRHLAQMYHPDKVAALAPEFQLLADQKMKEINWAYSLLKAARSSP